jgi:hypothetical protein
MFYVRCIRYVILGVLGGGGSGAYDVGNIGAREVILGNWVLLKTCE